MSTGLSPSQQGVHHPPVSAACRLFDCQHVIKKLNKISPQRVQMEAMSTLARTTLSATASNQTRNLFAAKGAVSGKRAAFATAGESWC